MITVLLNGAKKQNKSTFMLEVSPGMVQTDRDREVFDMEWKMRPGWKVTKLGKDHNLCYIDYLFKNKKKGRAYRRSDLEYYRHYWNFHSENPMQHRHRGKCVLPVKSALEHSPQHRRERKRRLRPICGRFSSFFYS